MQMKKKVMSGRFLLQIIFLQIFSENKIVKIILKNNIFYNFSILKYTIHFIFIQNQILKFFYE